MVAETRYSDALVRCTINKGAEHACIIILGLGYKVRVRVRVRVRG